MPLPRIPPSRRSDGFCFVDQEMPEVPGVLVDHRFYELTAGRFHVAHAGAPDRPTVLLLHGFPQHWWAWRGVINELAADANLVIPDLRGSGWSVAPGTRRAYRKRQLAGDVLELLDALDIPAATVVGHDWGGFIAQLVALRAPERVARLLAVSIPPVVQVGRPSLKALGALSYQLALAAPGSARTLQARPNRLAKAMRSDVRRRETFTAADAEQFAGQYRDRSLAKAAQLLYRSFVISDLATLRRETAGAQFAMPVEFLLSEHDAYIPQQLSRGASSLGVDVRVRMHDRSGHFLPDEDPQFLSARIREFAGLGASAIGPLR